MNETLDKSSCRSEHKFMSGEVFFFLFMESFENFAP